MNISVTAEAKSVSADSFVPRMFNVTASFLYVTSLSCSENTLSTTFSQLSGE